MWNIKTLRSIFAAMRLKHSIKNILVFIPIIFAKQLFQTELLLKQFSCFIIFTLASSFVYILNDMCDRKSDACHPMKCKRPFASGELSPVTGIIVSALLLLSSIFLNIWIAGNILSTLFLLLYILINIAYNTGCKKQMLLDVAILSMGFVIRILYGGAFTSIPVSNWLLLTIMAGSLFMAFGKRRNELRDLNNSEETRAVLKKYGLTFLDRCINTSVTLSVVFYSLWCYSKEEAPNSGYIWSVPLLFFIFLRYCWYIEKEDSDGDPVNVLLKDFCLQILSIIYIIYMGILLYQNQII